MTTDATESTQEMGPYERVLTVHVPESDLDAAKNRAARKISREVKIKGFRPGKAPRRVVEATVGEGRVRSEAIEEVLPELVGAAIEEAELEPAVTPSVEAMRDIDTGVEVDVRVTMWPRPGTIPVYAGREVEVENPALDDEVVQEQIDRFREQFAELETVSRPSHEGDFVSINLNASRGGQPLEEASATDLLYEVGSESFIEGLDGNVVGRSAGDIEQFDTTLPPGFGELAGTEVSMQVLVKEVRERRLPDLNDEWVSDSTEFETVEELRSELVSRMDEARLGSVRNAFQAKLVEELTAELGVELPEGIVNAEMEEIFHRFSHQLSESGIEFGDYLQISGMTQDAFVDDLRQQAMRSVSTDILLDAVAEHEALEVADDELAAMYGALAAQTQQDVTELTAQLAGSVQEKRIVGDILRRKALEAVVLGAVAVDEDGSPIDLGFEEEPEADAEEPATAAVAEDESAEPEPDPSDDEPAAEEPAAEEADETGEADGEEE